tara:strand:+ start:32 stop:622 length:591 start_codon:yes stop_codon:yes gene_type:complete
MSRINVDKITGATGTASGAPITLSGDTATLSGTGVTFPANMMIGIAQNQFNTECSAGGSSYSNGSWVSFSPAVNCTISNCTTGSKILISCYLHLSINESNRSGKIRLIDKTNSDAVIGTEGSGGLFGFYDYYSTQGGHLVSYEILYTPPSFSSGSFQVEVLGAIDDGGETMYVNAHQGNNTSREFSSNIILKEISG